MQPRSRTRRDRSPLLRGRSGFGRHDGFYVNVGLPIPTTTLHQAYFEHRPRAHQTGGIRTCLMNVTRTAPPPRDAVRQAPVHTHPSRRIALRSGRLASAVPGHRALAPPSSSRHGTGRFRFQTLTADTRRFVGLRSHRRRRGRGCRHITGRTLCPLSGEMWRSTSRGYVSTISGRLCRRAPATRAPAGERDNVGTRRL